MKSKAFDNNFFFYLIAVILGFATGYSDIPALSETASVLSEIFINLLKLVSLPIIFLSIVSTASGMKCLKEIRFLGLKVIRYTLLTTLIAASVALVAFLTLDPVSVNVSGNAEALPEITVSYWQHLRTMIPSNIVQPFYESNVIGVLFIAMALSFAVITLPDENRDVLHKFFSSLYGAVMKITMFIVRLMPIAVWAFVTLFVKDLQQGMEFHSLALYLAAILFSNLFQALVVLPIFLRYKGIRPFKLLRAMAPALYVAFFSKSSSAALPMAISCAKERAKVSNKVAGFTLPLCTTINMNACAAFILITVLFVSMSNGVTYTPFELFSWIFVATIAAVGNAGVPMGCYFLSSAFLASMNVPLNILGVILPFYTMIDMLESAINVWSDSCVTAAVQKELDHSQEVAVGNVVMSET